MAEAEGTVYHGHEGVRAWWKEVARALGGLRFEVQRLDVEEDGGLAELMVTARIEGVDVPQRMWQAFVVRDAKPVWWGTFRTEAEAREGLRGAL